MTRVGFTEEIREEIEIFLEFNENEKNYRHKTLNKILANSIQQYIIKIIDYNQVYFICGRQA